ncbi:uncharacterized protein GGS22DRAFT_162038 [Annulohypoxylon maeteangense]|uniref:uncharacterized protein n=1 Tax=Annulohypoxylon maeteangense TaxID=1927788 RepID=UPI002008C2D5|nr:uncharacterized protein GGS22DRAFT_162038 [Annulohypoxylon maeteangense]KAI0885799.1 hypothetical protein GGS22DRAFT_162038 [Annulohypoxylon maeteangense]
MKNNINSPSPFLISFLFFSPLFPFAKPFPTLLSAQNLRACVVYMRVCALVDHFLLWIFSTHPRIPILAAMYLHFGMGQLGWQPTAG